MLPTFWELRRAAWLQRKKTFSTPGREALIEQVQHNLDAVESGENHSLVLKGDYGEGKTHFLNIVFNYAQQKNFAVSFVVLSKETPFNRLDRVYPKVVAGTYLPGEQEPGFEMILRDIRPGSDTAEKLLDFARNELHPKIFYVLQNYLMAGDTYQQYLLYGDLAGNWLPISQLKSLNKLNFGRSARIERFRLKENSWDYFRFLAYLFKMRGLAGWVILFDEFELVGTLGLITRSEAYANLARFLFPEDGKKLTSTGAVFSIASRFWLDILLGERRQDIEEVPNKLFLKGERQKAELVRRALNALLQNTVTLETLPGREVYRMLAAVKDLHSKAYGWEPDIDLEKIWEATKHDRLRTKIRYMLEYLDLKYLYREEPVVTTGDLEETSLEEAPVGENEDLPDDKENLKTLFDNSF